MILEQLTNKISPEFKEWAAKQVDLHVEPCLPYMWKRPLKPMGLFFGAFLFSVVVERLTRPEKDAESASFINRAFQCSAVATALLTLHATSSLAPKAMKFVVARFR